MKIIWLHSHFLYSLGATKYIFEICKIINKKYELEVVVEDASKYWRKMFRYEKIKLIVTTEMSSNKVIYWLLFPFFILKDYLTINKLSKDGDLIISSIFPMNFISIFLRKPTIFLCFEPYSYFYNNGLINNLVLPKKIFTKILAFFYIPLDKWGTKIVTKIITLNDTRAFLIRKTYRRSVDGISGLSVNSRFFKPTRNLNLINKYKNNKIIFHSTDFTAPKGTLNLIRCFPLVVEKIPNLKLLIASTVQDKIEKEKLKVVIKNLKLENNIELLGLVEENKLPAYYSLSDITAFVADPRNTISRASLIVLESLSCETPVVCSSGQTAGMLDGKTGYFVNPTDKNELSEKIIKLLQDKKLASQMGKFGRQLVVSNYTWKNSFKVFEKIMQTL
jgi:glycosyltransferase involved in cell wall biosynthesis